MHEKKEDHHNPLCKGLKKTLSFFEHKKLRPQSSNKKKGDDLINHIGKICMGITQEGIPEHASEKATLLWNKINIVADKIELHRPQFAIYTKNDLGEDTNQHQFGETLEHFNEILKKIAELPLETDRKALLMNSELHTISINKIINQLIGASVDQRVLNYLKTNSSPEQYLAAKTLIRDVDCFYMQLQHFFREWLSEIYSSYCFQEYSALHPTI